MFGTLRWGSHTNEAEFVERPNGSSDLEKSPACDRCRAKKVKCTANYDGCNRCTRLGKACTFMSTKHRAIQKIRKANKKIAQQGFSVDLCMQPSASSSFKAAGDEAPRSPCNRPLGSSLATNENIEDSERSQQLLTISSTDRLTDMSPEFFTEFDQQTTDQEGDDIFNLVHSPTPLLSPSLTDTHTMPISNLAFRTPQNLISPSPSLGDEMQHYFQPTQHAMHPSLVENHSEPALQSLHASTTVSKEFSSHIPSVPSCQCLAAVIFAVEDFEAICNFGKRAELDSIVASEKEAIKCCRSILKCSSCLSKRENIVLLAFMLEKIVAACGRIVVLYHMKDIDPQARSASGSSSLLDYPSTDGFSRRIDAEDRDFTPSASSCSPRTEDTRCRSITSLQTDTPSDWQQLLLGDYEISSPQEWEYLVRILISFQLKAITQLLEDTKKIGSKALGETQTASLARAEMKIRELQNDVYIA